MLGFDVMVYRQKDDGGQEVLATWPAQWGFAWLDRLANEGRAKVVSRDGYPTRHELLAGEVQDLLQSPDADAPGGVLGLRWNARVDRRAALETCPRDAVVLVDEWDQS